MTNQSRQRTLGLLLALGAGILLFRTLRMLLAEQALEILLPSVLALLFLELMVDVTCIGLSLRWAFLHAERASGAALRAGAAATILHAFRVLVYVLGRIGPLKDFDRKPEFRGTSSVDWFWVWFAAVLSLAGLIAVLVIYICRKRSRRSQGPAVERGKTWG